MSPYWGLPGYSLWLFVLVVLAIITLALRRPFGTFYRPVGSRMTEDGAHESPPFSCNRKAIIGLACSGGGSRAAYLTAAVLKEIRRANVGLTMQGNLAGSGNLLEEISLISSVSGGSVAAAYYALNKEDLGADSEQRAWKTYLAKMALNHRQWWRFVYNPLIWAQFLLTNYNRGHWARGYYDRVLFCRKSLHELPNYPALYINAVDVMTEERFVFSKNTIHLSIQEDSPSLTHDLASSWVDPRSVRISDAVYASSAFPFVYPNLPLYNYAFNPPSIRFLADGGIFDNSGLLTLMVEMERAFSLSHNRCFILAICIDAENQWKENRLEVKKVTENDQKVRLEVFPFAGKQDYEAAIDYAWKGTVLRHGLTATDIVTSRAQKSVYQYLLRDSKLIWETALHGKFNRCETGSFEAFLAKTRHSPIENILLMNENERASAFERFTNSGEIWNPRWKSIFTHEGPLLAPGLIWMSLRDVVAGVSQLLDAETQDEDLKVLLENNGLEAMTRTKGPEREKSAVELGRRINEIPTDFKLSSSHRTLLDLAAYVLVHANLAPALAEWSHIANAKLDECGIDARDRPD